MPIKCLWFDRQQLLGRLRYLRFQWVKLGQYDAYSFIVSSFRPPTISTIPIGNVGPMLVKIIKLILVYEYYTGHLRSYTL